MAKNNKPNQNNGPKKATKKNQNQSLLKGYQQSSVIKPLTPKKIKRTVRSEVNLQFHPQMQQIKREQSAADLQARRIQSYFPQYEKSLRNDQQQIKNIYDVADSQLQAIDAGTSSYAENLRKTLQAEGTESAQLRGVGYNPQGDVTDALGQVARSKSIGTLRGVGRLQGASARVHSVEQKRIGKREMIDALQQEAARRRTYNQDAEDLSRQKGAAAKDALNTLRNQEQQFYLGLLSSHTSAKNAKTSAKTSRQNAQISAATQQRGQDISAATSRGNARISANQSNINSQRSNRGANRRARLADQNSPGDNSQNNVPKAVAKLRYFIQLHPSTHNQPTFASEQAAVAYLVSSGFTHKTAKKAVKRLAGGSSSNNAQDLNPWG